MIQEQRTKHWGTRNGLWDWTRHGNIRQVRKQRDLEYKINWNPEHLFSSSIIILSDGLHTFLTDECNNLWGLIAFAQRSLLRERNHSTLNVRSNVRRNDKSVTKEQSQWVTSPLRWKMTDLSIQTLTRTLISLCLTDLTPNFVALHSGTSDVHFLHVRCHFPECSVCDFHLKHDI